MKYAFYMVQNGLVAVPTCVINPGDYVLLPDPGYTDYLAGVLLADGKPVPQFRTATLFARLVHS